MYQEAAFLVLRLGGIGIIFAFIIGLIISIVRYYKLPVLSQFFEGYIELSRNTPLMIQLFFLYFGLPQVGIHLSAKSVAY